MVHQSHRYMKNILFALQTLIAILFLVFYFLFIPTIKPTDFKGQLSLLIKTQLILLTKLGEVINKAATSVRKCVLEYVGFTV